MRKFKTKCGKILQTPNKNHTFERQIQPTFLLMEEKDSPDLSPEENLRAENEIKALNLEMKHGATMFIGEDAPPKIIGEWLNNVTGYEDQYKNAGRIAVYDFIGRPAYATPDLLDKSTLPGEMERLQQLLIDKGIMVIRPDYVDDERYYRFLLNDVFPHEIPDIHIPGMITALDFEDFHPNHPEVIRLHVEEFLIDLLSLKKPYEGLWLSENLRNDHDTITREQALEIINTFRTTYREIVPVGFAPERVLNETKGTYFLFGIRWEGVAHSGGEREVYEGLGVIQMGYEDKVWLVQGVSMPGFKF